MNDLLYFSIQGEHCDENIDGCEDNPCPLGRNCTDLSPVEEGLVGRAYNCSECPSGYDEIDNKCQGRKLQCIITKTLFENRNNNTFTNPCNIRSKNVHGQGLFLLSDINECLSNQTNDCNPDNQFCANTDGGYLCTCLSGFRKHGNRCVGKVQYKDLCEK